MQVKPLQDRVLVERTSLENKTAGGIIIPDTNQEKPAEGKILAVGNGRQLSDGTVKPLDVKEGDNVLFGKFAGTEVKVNGKDCLIMKEEDVLGVIQ